MVRHTGEDFVDLERIAITTMFFLRASGIQSAELIAPKPDRFPCNENAALSKQVFDIPVAEIESVVEPHGIADDVGWKSMTFVVVHPPILVQIAGLTCQYSKRSSPHSV